MSGEDNASVVTLTPKGNCCLSTNKNVNVCVCLSMSYLCVLSSQLRLVSDTCYLWPMIQRLIRQSPPPVLDSDSADLIRYPRVFVAGFVPGTLQYVKLALSYLI